MNEERISFLLRVYAGNKATDEEVEELFEWLRLHPENEPIQTQLKKMAAVASPARDYEPQYWEPFVQKVLGTPVPARRISMWWRYAAAAVLLFVVGGLWFLVGRRGSEKPDIVQTPAVPDVAPGRNGAVLTLADGRTILLDSMANGIVAQQKGSTVALNNGQLKYEKSEAGSQKPEVTYNVLTTPRGRQFQLQLPDGSKVWLNAASSIRYPTAFKGETREVEITGEVYFEVEKDPQKTFVVTILPSTGEAGGSRVEVLGTHFNVNSYADEGSVKTTLLEGAVRITQNKESITLKPGEQGIAAGHSTLTIDHSPNIDQVIAWKNGLFNFKNAGIKTVMLQLARWYDIEVKYEGEIPSGTFRGKIPRDLRLSDVLAVLQDVEVRFRIEGKTLVVTK